MNKERMKRAFMTKIIAALLIIYLLVTGCTVYYSAAAKYREGENYTTQVMERLADGLNSCVSREKSKAVAGGMNLAMAAALMDQYDTELGIWDGASRINTIMLYREERGRDGRFHLKPVDAPDVHFLKEFSAGSQLLVLEDWFSPVHVGFFLRRGDQCDFIVEGYEKKGFIEPTKLWAGPWQDVSEAEWKEHYAQELIPMRKASGQKKEQIRLESSTVYSAGWQQEQTRDESWRLLEKDAEELTITRDEEMNPGVSWGEVSAKDGLLTSRHVGFIGLKTEGYWLGFCVIGTPLLTSFLDNLWMDFLIALVCFMVGILLISSYFRVLDEQYETELRRRKMSDAMAHEMKTPLGIIKNYSEALMEEEDAETRDQYLNTIVEETDGMNHMIVQMLDLSKMEAGTYPLKLSMLSVNRITEEIVKRTEILMKPKGLQAELSLAEETLILADEKLLEESISNLMLNAIRYSEPGSAIKLSVGYEAGGARIAVENRGPQIAEKDGQHIWESFYRGDEARSRESGGNGLGLSIAANTCALHRGSYGFENLEHGVRFWLQIPSQENRPKEKKSAAGPLLLREKRGLDLAGLRYTILGTVLWLIPYAVIFLVWRHGSPSDQIPYLLSLPGWILSWLGAWKLGKVNGRARLALWTIPVLLAAAIPIIGAGEVESLELFYNGRRLLLIIMGFYFAVITLTCKKTAQELGNVRLGKLLLLSAAAEAALLAGCTAIVVGIHENLVGNGILALTAMVTVFSICLWYDSYRRYHLRADI